MIGKNTISAVKSGFYWGYAGMIESIIKLISKQSKKNYEIIITGGYSNLFKNSINLKGVKMRKVAVIGVGLTKFGELWDKSYRELIAAAGAKALMNAGIEGKEIEAIFGSTMASGRLIGQEHIGALIADHLGLNQFTAFRLEAACASGSIALRTAAMSILSGEHEVVAVGGVEKMTDVKTGEASTALGGAGDQETELFFGATFPALYALMATRYMKEFNATEEQLAAASVKNHENALNNEYAQFHRKITIENVMNSGYVSWPLKLLDCSPLTDGSATVILEEATKANKITDKAIEII